MHRLRPNVSHWLPWRKSLTSPWHSSANPSNLGVSCRHLRIKVVLLQRILVLFRHCACRSYWHDTSKPWIACLKSSDGEVMRPSSATAILLVAVGRNIGRTTYQGAFSTPLYCARGTSERGGRSPASRKQFDTVWKVTYSASFVL